MLRIPDSVKLPNSAYSYWPPEDQVKSDNLTQRLIFSRQEYSPDESKAISAAQREMRKKRIHVPSFWDDTNTLRFLYACDFKIDLTIREIQSHLEWLESRPEDYKILFNQSHNILVEYIQNSGGIYIHGRDHRFRPLIILKPSLLLTFKVSYK